MECAKVAIFCSAGHKYVLMMQSFIIVVTIHLINKLILQMNVVISVDCCLGPT